MYSATFTTCSHMLSFHASIVNFFCCQNNWPSKSDVLHNHDALYRWIRLNGETVVTYSFYASQLVTRDTASIENLYDCVGGSSSGLNERNKREPEQMVKLADAHKAHKTVRSCLQHTLNLQLLQFPITDFLGVVRGSLHTGINITFYYLCRPES
jgi:hypothetical protein